MTILSSRGVEAGAAAIANARANRRGAPDISNILEVLQQRMPKLYDEVMEDARAAIIAYLAAEKEKGE